MEFTKEQIEFIKEEWRNSTLGFAPEFLDSLLKPETKFIDVRIEYESDNFPLTADRVKSALELKYDITFRNFKVKELPEVFSKKDLIEFANYHHHVDETVETNINDWLSERKSK